MHQRDIILHAVWKKSMWVILFKERPDVFTLFSRTDTPPFNPLAYTPLPTLPHFRKLPAITQVNFFQTACEMTSRGCVSGRAVSTKKTCTLLCLYISKWFNTQKWHYFPTLITVTLQINIISTNLTNNVYESDLPIMGTSYSAVRLYICYKLVQGFRVTCLFTCQYNTKGYDMVTDVK